MPSPEDVQMEDGSAPEVSREAVQALIDEAENAELIEGETWYLVSQKWWNALLKAVRDGFLDDVGAIDNSQISESRNGNFFLKHRLAEAVDYTPLPEKVFRRLEAIYQVEDERRDYINRVVVKKNGTTVIEVYPRIVHASLARNSNIKADIRLKANDDMEKLGRRVCEELSLDNASKIRFYVMNGENPELIDMTQSLDSYFDTVQKVVVDTMENGEYFYKAKSAIQPQGKSLFGEQNSSSLTGNGSIASSSSNNGGSSPVTGAPCRQAPGQCGLSNLGNTCFMASALQCLSNMPPLRDYFLSDEYHKDVNVDNPLGTRGSLAYTVGDLLKGIWSGEYSSVNPRRFKGVIGQFAPRFNGYSQQDAHELMAYVLDGLHEDLNRIKKKPYIEDNDEHAKLPEAVQAQKSWEVYKMRNDSIIVDTLHGQLRSTLICPVCEKVSIKFDPFGYLSLPLPPKEQIVKQSVIVMFRDRKWAKFSLGVTEHTSIATAEELMLAKLQLDRPHFFVFFYVPSQFNDDVQLLRPTDPVRYQGREVYCAEVQHDPTIPGTRIFVAYNRAKVMRSCSLPMLYSVEPNTPLVRSSVVENVLEVTKRFFIKGSQEMNTSGSNADDDDSMSGSNEDPREPYKLLVVAGGGNNAAPLPLAPTNDPIPFPDDGTQRSHDIYRNYISIIFQWKEMKFFNSYRGADLIEREMTVSTRRKVELLETLDWFTTKEQLGEQDSWYCPQCKKHERATKQLDLWKLPEILILHLKRFQYTKWSREKLTWEVVIPVRGLDLTDKVANPNHEKAIYDLIAVCRHYGSLSGGHYTAIGYNDKVQKWVDFNDSCTHFIPSPDEPYESSDPYMLVYRRRPLDASGQPINMEEVTETVETPSARAKRAAARHQVDENMEMEED